MNEQTVKKQLRDIKKWAIANYGEDERLSQYMSGALIKAGWQTKLRKILDEA